MHDYLLALIGGVLIGLAAVLVMASHGKIMGVSGIISRLLPPVVADWSWRVAFVAGILVTPIVYQLLTDSTPTIDLTNNIGLLIIAGLLVGIGTVTGNGCTSGHGVCGLPRLSIRSFIATGTFMVVAMVTVYISRYIVGG